MGNLVVSNAHTPAYRRSGLKRKHGAPQVLEQELSTASDPPQPKLGGLCQGAHKFCTVRGIILAQCKHSPQPAATKANTRLARTQEDARKAPGSLPLIMHGDETIHARKPMLQPRTPPMRQKLPATRPRINESPSSNTIGSAADNHDTRYQKYATRY